MECPSCLPLNPTDFAVERGRYVRDKHYRLAVRNRAGCGGCTTRTEGLERAEVQLREEWELLCKGGQFSPAKFRAAAIVLIEEPNRKRAGLSW